MAQKLIATLAILASAAIAATWLFAVPVQEPTKSFQQSESPRQAGEFNPQTVIENPFDAITDVPFKTAEEGSKTLGDAMLVLGVEYDGVAKAYPIGMLCGPSREIINDTFGEHALAATW